MKQRLFHLSNKNLDNQIIEPRIPNNFMVKLGYEDNAIPKISFAPSVQNCILGIGFNKIKEGSKIYYVLEPSDYTKIKIISNKELVEKSLTPDAKITKEVWVTNHCLLKCTSKIKITNTTNKYETVYFNGKEITKQYYWNYKILET